MISHPILYLRPSRGTADPDFSAEAWNERVTSAYRKFLSDNGVESNESDRLSLQNSKCFDDVNEQCWTIWLNLEQSVVAQSEDPRGRASPTGYSRAGWNQWIQRVPILCTLTSFQLIRVEQERVEQHLLGGVVVPNVSRAIHKDKATEFVNEKLLALNDFGKEYSDRGWFINLVVYQEQEQESKRDLEEHLRHFQQRSLPDLQNGDKLFEYRIEPEDEEGMDSVAKLYLHIRDGKLKEVTNLIHDILAKSDIPAERIVVEALKIVANEVSGQEDVKASVAAILDVGLRGACRDLNLNAADEDHLTALHHAAEANNVDVMRSLLLRGAKVNEPDGMQMQAPLHLASGGGNHDAVIALMDHGADAKVTSRQFDTPLHLAAKAGCVGSVSTLLDRGADINARNDKDRTALLEAIEAKHVGVVDALLSDKHEEINWETLVSTDPYAGLTERDRAISCADNGNASNILELLVSKLKLVQVESRTESTINLEVPDGAALVYLIVKHDLSDGLKPLLDEMVGGGTNGPRCIPRLGFDWQRALSELPNWDGSITLLDIAVASNHQRLVEQIIKYIEANPTSGITSPLKLVDQMRERGGEFRADVIELLIRHCLVCNLASREGLIQYAIAYGCKTLAEELLNGGN